MIITHSKTIRRGNGKFTRDLYYIDISINGEKKGYYQLYISPAVSKEERERAIWREFFRCKKAGYADLIEQRRQSIM